MPAWGEAVAEKTQAKAEAENQRGALRFARHECQGPVGGSVSGQRNQHRLRFVGVHQKTETARHGEHAGDGKIVQFGFVTATPAGAIEQEPDQGDPEAIASRAASCSGSSQENRVPVSAAVQ